MAKNGIFVTCGKNFDIFSILPSCEKIPLKTMVLLTLPVKGAKVYPLQGLHM